MERRQGNALASTSPITASGLSSATYFSPRQLVALTTFSDLVTEARERVERDAIVAGLPDDSTPLRDGGTGAKAYAEAVARVFGVCAGAR